MQQRIKDKRVLFITTKNLDYIRNVQEINIIEREADSLTVIGSYGKNYIVRLLNVYFKILFSSVKNFDVIFIGFAPQLVLPLFWWKFKHSEVVIDFFISMYDTLCCDRRKIKPNSLLGKLLHRIDENTLRYASCIICDTNAHGDFFVEEFGADRDKVETLYLEADTSIYYPREVKRPVEWDGKKIVLYFGSVLPLQGVDVVWDAILKWNKSAGADIVQFVMIGPYTPVDGCVPANVTLIPWLSQDELASYINMADLCLAGHFNGSIGKAKRTIPGKAYIYKACGKRMILGDNEANRELFAEGDGVVFVKMGDPVAIKDGIEKLLI